MNKEVRKWNYDSVKEFLNNNGYELLDKSYKNVGTKMIMKDFYGYFYYITLNTFITNNNPRKFAPINPYTIQNIKLWCKLNNKPFELISEKYENHNKHLKWKCLKKGCEEVFNASWGNIYNNWGCPFCVGRKAGLSNCLATKNPELAKEWHPTKNGDLTPYNVTPNSNKRVWWQCKNNPKHEWDAKIANRNALGSNCPYCAGQLASNDYNLLIINPELCKEWDYTKNKKKPENYTPNSDKKVWWKCSKNSKHEWQEQIINRNKGYNCPYCSGKRPSEDYNLLVCNPELCEEWNYKRNKKLPLEYTSGSNKKVWWICKECGYEWETSIGRRSGKQKSGCPECSKSKGEIRINNYLKGNNIKYIPQKEYDGLLGVGNGNLSYDFYLPDYNLLIEYQGEQHEHYCKGFHSSKKDFKVQKEHDKRKKQYSIDNNINMLEIWYWDYNNIEKILSEEIVKGYDLCLNLL